MARSEELIRADTIIVQVTVKQDTLKPSDDTDALRS